MKKTIEPKVRPVRRMGIAETKEKLSQVVREIEQAPVVIHNRGRELAVLLDFGEWQRLTASSSSETGGAAFVSRIEAIKQRFGAVRDFVPGEFDFVPEAPFDAGMRGKR